MSKGEVNESHNKMNNRCLAVWKDTASEVQESNNKG